MNFKVVCGFPGSGKSTFVRNSISKNDIVYDYDELITTISLSKRHINNEVAHRYVLDILDAIIERAKTDSTEGTVWIIRTVPDENFQARMLNLDVEWLYINKTVFECLEQISNDPERIDSDKNWGSILMELQREGENGKFDICKFIN
ncbi:hypothetical protein KZ537_002436 [Enterococcus faecalis]|nr:hypothetical protein [Enterococcus faecalis]EIA7730284.1 hypothetical protein [Enterococcus faecalis]